eukprot:6637203-Pyramimonas_sp.AAC.1
MTCLSHDAGQSDFRGSYRHLRCRLPRGAGALEDCRAGPLGWPCRPAPPEMSSRAKTSRLGPGAGAGLIAGAAGLRLRRHPHRRLP